jgi:CHAT domain-containing protein
MRDWYRRMAAGQDVAAALRGAQLALATDYPHPYYWAPFVLVGGVRPPAATRRNRKEAA